MCAKLTGDSAMAGQIQPPGGRFSVQRCVSLMNPASPGPTHVNKRRHHDASLPARVGNTTAGLTTILGSLTVHHMENYSARLDRTFAALGDPTRRAILACLERQTGATVSELAKPFAIKLPAVMKHLDVLDEAGLITRSKTGRTSPSASRPNACGRPSTGSAATSAWSASPDRRAIA